MTKKELKYFSPISHPRVAKIVLAGYNLARKTKGP
jgi:hypothetical protein